MMSRAKRVSLGLVICAGLFTGCGPVMAASDADKFKAAYAEADAERKKAAKVGMEWRDTKKMLKKAQELAESGKYADAIQLAEEAKMQGIYGQRQAKEQAEAWKAAVLK